MIYFMIHLYNFR